MEFKFWVMFLNFQVNICKNFIVKMKKKKKEKRGDFTKKKMLQKWVFNNKTFTNCFTKFNSNLLGVILCP